MGNYAGIEDVAWETFTWQQKLELLHIGGMWVRMPKKYNYKYSFDEREMETINEVYDYYHKYSVDELQSGMRSKRGAWWRTISGNNRYNFRYEYFDEIPDKWIKEEFEKKGEKNAK